MGADIEIKSHNRIETRKAMSAIEANIFTKKKEKKKLVYMWTSTQHNTLKVRERDKVDEGGYEMKSVEKALFELEVFGSWE